MTKTIYLDNAATTYPKPHSVYSEVQKCMKRYGGNPGRGSHKLAALASEAIYECREVAGDFFGADSDKVVMTYNATHALNMAIKGFAEKGRHILISDIEHNSVYRPVWSLTKSLNCEFSVYGSFGGDANRILADIEKKTKPNTKIVVASHASNICNTTLPIKKIGEFCRKRGYIFIVDASQSAGHYPIDMASMNIDVLCAPGHKGLYGPQGSGLLIYGSEKQIGTILEGGSGVNSLDADMPEIMPERLEAGTLSAPAAAGLKAGIEWVNKVGVNALHSHERELSTFFYEELAGEDDIKFYSDNCDGSVMLFNVIGMSPVEVGRLLDDYGICVRTGFHCSPLGHKTLGTGEDGAVRVSFGYMNTLMDVRRLIDAVYNIKTSII